jgi:hypothetical protein
MRFRLSRLTLFAIVFFGLSGIAGAQVSRSSGQLMYLPIYSHIWHGDVDSSGRPAKTLVSILVSIRNTDPAEPIRLMSAQYFDTDGRRIKEYVAKPTLIGPLGTYEIFVPRGDDKGGSGANFVVSWKAGSPVSLPLIEGVHANLPAARSIAFITTARPIPSK